MTHIVRKSFTVGLEKISSERGLKCLCLYLFDVVSLCWYCSNNSPRLSSTLGRLLPFDCLPTTVYFCSSLSMSNLILYSSDVSYSLSETGDLRFLRDRTSSVHTMFRLYSSPRLLTPLVNLRIYTLRHEGQ